MNLFSKFFGKKKEGSFVIKEVADKNSIVGFILNWAEERNLLRRKGVLAQLGKLLEESGELASAILKGDKEKQKDSIGDVFIVITILAAQLGFSVEECILHSWNEIKDRTGKTSSDGSFIKDE